jgi:S1-C subfamily serine protease
MGIGSGVILQIEHGSALIVTNRHVVDPKFEAQESTGAKLRR